MCEVRIISNSLEIISKEATLQITMVEPAWAAGAVVESQCNGPGYGHCSVSCVYKQPDKTIVFMYRSFNVIKIVH